MIKAKILEKRLIIEGGITSDSVKFETVEFSFPEEWDGYEKTVVFSNDEGVQLNVILNLEDALCTGSNQCYIPHEVINSPGFSVSVFGIKGDSVATTTKEFVRVIESGFALGDEPKEPTPSEYQQLINLTESVVGIANSVREDADNGVFDGQKGDKGDKGDAGVYYGEEQPTDPTHPVWIKPDGELSIYLDLVYPVGSIYLSANSSNPQTLFGGKWEQIKDRFLLSAGDIYSGGSMGGESEHSLTVEEMPSHKHNPRFNSGDTSYYASNVDSGQGWMVLTNGSEGIAGLYITDTGGNQPHNNMPPYLAVYVWKRIA